MGRMYTLNGVWATYAVRDKVRTVSVYRVSNTLRTVVIPCITICCMLGSREITYKKDSSHIFRPSSSTDVCAPIPFLMVLLIWTYRGAHSEFSTIGACVFHCQVGFTNSATENVQKFVKPATFISQPTTISVRESSFRSFIVPSFLKHSCRRPRQTIPETFLDFQCLKWFRRRLRFTINDDWLDQHCVWPGTGRRRRLIRVSWIAGLQQYTGRRRLPCDSG